MSTRINRTENPQFCIITPTAYLEQFASQSSMHLVLAHLVDTDEQYADFYARRSEYKIIDNGAFELGESYDPEKLIDLAKKCKADAVVLPDYPAQHSLRTIEAAQKLAPQVHEAGFKTMFVPQSEVGELEQWIDAYKWGTERTDLVDIMGMSILAMPNAIPHIPRAYARVVLTQLLLDRGIFDHSLYHHYLGLNSGPNLEVPPLLKMGAMDSCDSSSPVWHGLLGHQYSQNTDSLLPVQKVKMPVDFSCPFVNDQATLNRIQTNIDLTLNLFNFKG